jgi:hypothetical protein
MNETLKFPTGEFTHTELAQLNGKTNQQVWTRYQAAIKDGTIVSAGTRPSAGKGKPSKLWKLNPNPTQPVPVAVVTTPAPEVTAPAIVAPTEAVVVPAVQPAEVKPEPVVETPKAVEPAKLPEVTPAPVTATVEVIHVEPASEVKPLPVVAPKNIVKDARQLTEKCPICGNPLYAVNDATGVTVWCAQGPEVCCLNEAPFGHGDTDRKAYEILIDKWTRKTGVPAPAA